MLHELLVDEIEVLYIAFKDNHPGILDSCPCCTDGTEFEKLAEYDVRDVPAALTDMYMSEAVWTAGEAGDFRYYLPRILELTLREENGLYPESLASIVRYTRLDSWSAEHRNALVDFYYATIQRIIEWEYFDTLDNWICAIGTSECGIEPFLQLIENSPAAVVAFFAANVPKVNQGRLCGAWKRSSKEHDTVVEWFYSPRVRQILREACGISLPTWKLN